MTAARQSQIVTVLVLAGILAVAPIEPAASQNLARVTAPAPPPPSPEKRPEAFEVPMELIAGRPLTRVTVNGQGPFGFLIDPQADHASVDATLVEALRVKPTAPGTSLLLELILGSKHTLGALPVEALDTSRVVSDLASNARPRGILSLSLWKDQLVTIDFARWRLKIEPGALPEPNGTDVFALRAPLHELFVPLKVNEQSLWCRVDPLFARGLVLPASYLELLPVEGKPLDVGPAHIRQANVPVREARLAAKVSVAAFDFETPIVLFGDVGEMAVVGTRWLSGFAITYDMTNGRARLERIRP